MKLTEWREKLDWHNKKVEEATRILSDAEYERNQFFRDTLGIDVGSTVTLPGTVAMIHKAIAMEKEEGCK